MDIIPVGYHIGSGLVSCLGTVRALSGWIDVAWEVSRGRRIALN